MTPRLTTLLTTTLFALPGSLVLSGSLAAQNMPVPDGRGRLLQLFDLDTIVAGRGSSADAPAPADGPVLKLQPPGVAPAGAPGVALAAGAPAQAGPAATARAQGDAWSPSNPEVTSFLRRFVVPPLGPGDDLQILGDRWLALLGSPAQIASAEKLFATAATYRLRMVHVEVQVLTVKQQAFGATIRAQLQAAEHQDQPTWHGILTDDAAASLQQKAADAGAEVLNSPSLLVYPLQQSIISIIDQTAYVQDFTVVRNGDSVVAEPVVGTVWDGIKTGLVATWLDAERIAVAFTLEIQQLQRPIPEFTTTVATGAPPVTIQLPRTTGLRFEQVAQVRQGERVVFAAQKIDGDYLMVLMRAWSLPEERK